MKTPKRLESALKAYDIDATYTVPEAVKILVDTAKVKFDATAELHMKLSIDPRQADQQIRSTVSLPNGTGKKVRVIAFVSDDKVADCKKEGAVESGGEELITKVASGYTDFDTAIATPDMMRHLAKIARVLGPKGLMPSPKAGTVSDDPATTVKELIAGRLEVRNDKAGIIHSIFGKVSMGDKKLEENLIKLIQTVKELRPTSQKGTYIQSITINSTMGTGIKIAI